MVKQNLFSGRDYSHDTIGSSTAWRKVLGYIDKVAPTNATVLIVGESGTGKEHVAKAIYEKSGRNSLGLYVVNCGELTPNDTSVSSLLGHEKGAYTGAHQLKRGTFELASGKTLFLDEIAELPPELQGALLRVLEYGDFRRVGGTRSINTDVRIIAASTQNLAELVRVGKMSEMLRYRLEVFPIYVPPLRDRGDDKAELAHYFLKLFGQQHEKVIKVDESAVDFINSYHWPGNVRELRNLMERAVILFGGTQQTLERKNLESFVEQPISRRDLINGKPSRPHLPFQDGYKPSGTLVKVNGHEILIHPTSDGLSRLYHPNRSSALNATSAHGSGLEEVAEYDLKEVSKRAAGEAEKALIKQVLDEVRWNKTAARKKLKISFKALLYKIRGYGLEE